MSNRVETVAEEGQSEKNAGLEGDDCIFLFLDNGTAAADACRCLLLLLRLCRCCS